MTIDGWVVFAIIAICLILGAICGAVLCENIAARITIPIVCALATIGLLIGMLWYFGNTASGQRAMVDQQSDLETGLTALSECIKLMETSSQSLREKSTLKGTTVGMSCSTMKENDIHTITAL